MIALRSLLVLALLFIAVPLLAQDDAPWMGIHVVVIDQAERDKLKITSGLRVTEVVKDSPADKAGLEKEDIILSAGEKEVNTIKDLSDVLAKKRPGDTIGLGVRHSNGKTEPMIITLGRKGGDTGGEFLDDPKLKELREQLAKRRQEARELEEAIKKRLEELRSKKPEPEKPKVEEPKPDPTPKVDTTEPPKTEVKVKLGASFSDVDSDEARKLGIDSGLTTVKVTAASAAAKAGLKEGDVVYEVGGEKVTGTGHLRTLLAKYNPGDKVEFKIVRNGKKDSVTVTLDAR